MALSVPVTKQDTGDKTEFTGTPSDPEILDNTTDLPFASIAPNHLPYDGGEDSYTGIPGDGIVPG